MSLSGQSTSFVKPATKIKIRQCLYLLAYVPLLGTVHLWQIGEDYGILNWTAWAMVLYVFGFVPILDQLIGIDKVNPEVGEETARLAASQYYRWITLMVCPVLYALVLWYGYKVCTSDQLNFWGYLGAILSLGTGMSAIGITVGHELVHKDTWLERSAGGLLFALTFYGGFKVEHVYGHHYNVSTPEDASSARYGQSLYQFLPRAYYHNFKNAWLLQAKRLKRQKKQFWNPLHNELLSLYAVSLGLTLYFGLSYGWLGVVFYLACSFVSFSLLEVINYVEHYGLHRRKLPNGRYERTNHHHSWNSSHLLTNMFLFHLQRHSDHHANATYRYQVLRHFDDSPQLPSGYATMTILALIPPLWFRVMNPRVEAYYLDSPETLRMAK